MDRLIDGGAPALAWLARASWETGRAGRTLVRRYGMAAPWLLGCLALALAALGFAYQQHARAAALRATLAQRMALPVPAPALPAPTGMAAARARLHAFERQLLPHAELPFALQDLIALGAAEGLSMARGAYRPQVDVAGGFLRYRMTLPVKGSAPAIQAFMLAALHSQPSLALDSVQITRAKIGVNEIEARIQWVLLAQLPAAPAKPAREVR